MTRREFLNEMWLLFIYISVLVLFYGCISKSFEITITSLVNLGLSMAYFIWRMESEDKE